MKVPQAIANLRSRLAPPLPHLCPSSVIQFSYSILALLLACTTASAIPRFTLERMVSPISPNDQSHATDINDAGYVTVNFYNKLYAGSWYSYVFKDGQAGPPDMSYALKINNHNQVTGYGGSSDSSFGGFWNGTTSLRLDELPGGQYWNRPYALNDAGQIYGYSLGDPASPEGFQRAVGWFPTGQVFGLGIPAAGSWGNIAQAVNNLNQVVGYRDGRNTSPVDTSRAWLWQSGNTDLLPPLPGALQPRSWAYSINEYSQIVGAYFDDLPGGTSGGAALWQNGQLSILPDPAGAQFGFGYDINDDAYVVGLASLNAAPYWTATLWDPAGNAYLLDSLVNNLQGWKLERALAINNRNQIVGIANDAQGQQHGFLLTPVVPEPSSAAMLTSALFIILYFRRKT